MPSNKNEAKINLNDSLKELSGIVGWFEDQQEIDVEKGLENVKKGVALIKACKERLSTIENEFIAIKREISEDSQSPVLPGEKADVAHVDPDNIPF